MGALVVSYKKAKKKEKEKMKELSKVLDDLELATKELLEALIGLIGDLEKELKGEGKNETN